MAQRGLIGGTILALAAAQPAFAAQCATVSFSPANVTVPNWNPIVPGAQQASFTATVTRAKNTTATIRIIFFDSNDTAEPVKLGLTGGHNGPLYQIIDPAGRNMIYPRNTAVTSVKGPNQVEYQNKSSNDTVSVAFRLVVPANSPGTDFFSGSYAETLNYGVSCALSGDKDNGSDGPVAGPAVAMTIPNLVSMTTAGAATLDFQNFTSLSQQFNVGLKSTGPINVAIDSANKLNMVRLGAPSPYPDNSLIKYSITLLGNIITTTPQQLPNQARAGVAGSTWPLLLSLPSTPSGKVAGSYSDTLTLTLTPGS
jgi:hypothetical protein